jgi:hypothetical protein
MHAPTRNRLASCSVQGRRPQMSNGARTTRTTRRLMRSAAADHAADQAAWMSACFVCNTAIKKTVVVTWMDPGLPAMRQTFKKRPSEPWMDGVLHHCQALPFKNDVLCPARRGSWWRWYDSGTRSTIIVNFMAFGRGSHTFSRLKGIANQLLAIPLCQLRAQLPCLGKIERSAPNCAAGSVLGNVVRQNKLWTVWARTITSRVLM